MSFWLKGRNERTNETRKIKKKRSIMNGRNEKNVRNETKQKEKREEPERTRCPNAPRHPPIMDQAFIHLLIATVQVELYPLDVVNHLAETHSDDAHSPAGPLAESAAVLSAASFSTFVDYPDTLRRISRYACVLACRSNMLRGVYTTDGL